MMITQRFLVILGLAAIAVAALSTLYLGMVIPDRWWSFEEETVLVVSVTSSFVVLCIPLRRLLLWGDDWRTGLTIVTALVAAGVGLWVFFAWMGPWLETL